MTPRTKFLVALPLVAAFVIILAYFRLFTNPVVIVLIFVLYVAVSLRNRKKFNSERSDGQAKEKPKR